ncbi:acyl carrier protein [Campylobacter sp. RM10532]|uniref:acyl carrier protein n=1 Tax=Campylobacter molothri TaxID=1032242 RepID=UPI001E0A3AC0|nr:acyl carrier protein [Campylobacter sp. RM10542]MBZ7930533.1 acyl carrier protein [Campylobacter sp. W0067]MBZ7938174.1 acyl carrier protein [Campylobacter sp. RM10538]MBZ7945201.1 acyl carrier protein [Campylobacter sp. RM10532]MBZ7948775.1 acyl carrier protein [Campylobacter sp. RM9929]MBZ7956156.1 acyl carrier protein [Campylobacter sp. RM17709]MBZ7961959.1 acyl carrier protein [Campylobacter sp. W0049]
MEEIKQFFIKIGRADVDENMRNLVSDNIIDSLDVMNLINEIEKHYNKTLDSDFMRPMHFESFENIQKMLELAMKD